jgi:hypothetical protein
LLGQVLADRLELDEPVPVPVHIDRDIAMGQVPVDVIEVGKGGRVLDLHRDIAAAIPALVAGMGSGQLQQRQLERTPAHDVFSVRLRHGSPFGNFGPERRS